MPIAGPRWHSRCMPADDMAVRSGHSEVAAVARGVNAPIDPAARWPVPSGWRIESAARAGRARLLHTDCPADCRLLRSRDAQAPHPSSGPRQTRARPWTPPHARRRTPRRGHRRRDHLAATGPRQHHHHRPRPQSLGPGHTRSPAFPPGGHVPPRAGPRAGLSATSAEFLPGPQLDTVAKDVRGLRRPKRPHPRLPYGRRAQLWTAFSDCLTPIAPATGVDPWVIVACVV